ncbi:hypothetical protein B0H11DRAFT_122052 [Mycena galericulata]|nr:hypothetical protein B0H11DRAFT_122052 [Mycena galericulata]
MSFAPQLPGRISPLRDAAVSRATEPRASGTSSFSELSESDDTLMDWTSSPSHETSSTAPGSASPLKRKRVVLDYVSIPTPEPGSGVARSDRISLENPPLDLRKKGRQTEFVTPRRNPPRNDGVPSRIPTRIQKPHSEPVRNDQRETTSSPPESPDERGAFVADMEHCIDTILNQLAEEAQRREELQQKYAARSYGSASKPAVDVSSSFVDTADPDFVPDPCDDLSDDELSQSLFDTPFSNLPFRDVEPMSSDLVSPASDLAHVRTVDANSDRARAQRSFLDDVVADDGLPAGFRVARTSQPMRSVEPMAVVVVPTQHLLRTGVSPLSPKTAPELPESAESFPPGATPGALLQNIISTSSTSGADDHDLFSGVRMSPAESSSIEPSPTLTQAYTWPEGPDDDIEMHSLSDSDSDDLDSTLSGSRSRCPCNQCSPRATTHPDYKPSRHSQQDVHRLFFLSPFARH